MGQARYDREFKELVVKRILNGETTTAEMTRELELHYTTVRDWVRQYKKDGHGAFPGSGHLKPDDEVVRKLRKELGT